MNTTETSQLPPPIEGRAFPRENPGCFHSLMSYLAELTGQSYYKQLEFTDIKHLRTPPSRVAKKTKLKYPSDRIIVVDAEGKRYAYMQPYNKRCDECGIVPVKFIVDVYKTYEDFGVELKPAGKYKDSLGGGWYSNEYLYEINGNYFCPGMECAHR